MAGAQRLSVWLMTSFLLADVASAGPRVAPGAKPASGCLLIASEHLLDPNFSRSVVLIVAYGTDGAMGLVVNRPTTVTLASAFPDIAELKASKLRLYLGGPVAPDLLLMLLRAGKASANSRRIFDDVYVSGSRDALRSVAQHKGSVNRLRVFAGHAGWAPRQLDTEIARGDWYVTNADAGTLFETPAEEMWRRLVERLSGDWAMARETPSNVAAATY